MTAKSEERRAQRLVVNLPTVVEKLGQRQVPLHPILVPVYERVQPNLDDVGLKLPGSIKDLSTNGCFIASVPLPLLSRVAFSFSLPGFGPIDTLAWVLWRRREDAEIPAQNGGAGKLMRLPAGFGVLFEAIALDARAAIARAVSEGGR
jgi:hypothetical protein